MSKRAQERMKKIQQAMMPLVGDIRFQTFMEEVEQQQKAAMLDACNERVVANERLTLAAIGEVRAYDGLISFYQSQIEAAEQMRDQAPG